MSNKAHNVGKVLEYLYRGGSISIQGQDCFLCESDNGDLDLGVKATSTNSDTGETKDVFLRMHISLGDFIKEVEKMSDEDWMRIVVDSVLSKKCFE